MRQKNTIGSTNKVKNTLKQEIYHFYFHFTHILEISRFEVPISRFFWAFLQGLQICTFWRLAGLLGTPSLRKIVCGEPRVSEDDEIESDILPCFGRNFDSFINHLLLSHCFAQYAASILDLVHTQNHAMKYDKHRDILTTQFANKVR